MVRRVIQGSDRPFQVVNAKDFEALVRELRVGGTRDEFVARQIVDDCYRLGKDITNRQHVVEYLVRQVRI